MRVLAAAGLTACLLALSAPATVRAETETQVEADQRVWMALQQEANARPSFDVRWFTLTGQRDDAKFCRTPATPVALPAAGAKPEELAAFAQRFGGTAAKAGVQRFLFAERTGRVRIFSSVATSSKPMFAGVEANPAPGSAGGFDVAIHIRPLADMRPGPRPARIAPGQTLYASARPQRRSRECVVVAATPLDSAQKQAVAEAAAAQTKPFLASVPEHETGPRIMREGWRPSHAPLSGRVEVVYLATIDATGKTVWTQLVSATPGADPSVLEAALFEEHTRSYRAATREGRPITAHGVRSVAFYPGRWIIGTPNNEGLRTLGGPEELRPRK